MKSVGKSLFTGKEDPEESHSTIKVVSELSANSRQDSTGTPSVYPPSAKRDSCPYLSLIHTGG